MQINNHKLSCTQGFVSPLRVIDQNTSIRAQASPNDFQRFHLSETQRLKRRITNVTQVQTPTNPLFRSIRISYKENVALQTDLKNFSSIKNNQHHPSGKVHNFQFQTTPNKFNLVSKRQLRTVSINPFDLQVPISEQICKTQEKIEDASLKQSDFYKLKELGKGKFGTVWLVRHKTTSFLCAMKIIKKSVVREEKVEHQVAKEIRIHNALKHVNIIGFYGYFHTEQNFFILTEYATGGQVYSLIKKKFRLSEEEVYPIVKQTAQGLHFMHNLGYIHRDIKPENLILQFDTVKICDLGWAAQCSYNEMRKSVCGTPLYYSPEIVRQTQHNALIDVWSLGILAYELLVGRIPFRIWSEFDLHIILQQQVTFPDYIDLEDDTKDFILNCLAKIPQLRPKISTLKTHPFLKYKKNQIPMELFKEVQSIF